VKHPVAIRKWDKYDALDDQINCTVITLEIIDKVLDQQIKEMEALDQLKDDFLSTISHELRSPMTNIKMATQMLKLLLQLDKNNEDGETQVWDDPERAKFKAKVDHYLLILEQECNREMDLLNNFLDLQQLDARNYRLNQTTVNLQEFIPQVIKPFLSRATNQQQTLQLKIDNNLSILKVDQTSLERILTELVCNACKFTPVGGEIIVELCLTSLSVSALSTLLLRVKNSGVEIPLNEYSRIFDRFYRIPNGDRWKHDGTGLGLALVKKLTEHLGGVIQVESEAGQTCFTVEIPVDC
jgi:signal transduction histidine kinase